MRKLGLRGQYVAVNPKSEIQNPRSVLILAAGEARRFDYFPKQLLEFEGRSLVRRAVETALDSTADFVCVVLGAYAERIKPHIDDLPVLIVVNESWADGIGSSIKSGLEILIQQVPDVESVAIILADQPLIDASVIDRLFASAADSGIAAAEYAGTVGVPAVFSAEFFEELLGLDPSEGAKRVISGNPNRTSRILVPSANLDIDEPSDFAELCNISVTNN